MYNQTFKTVSGEPTNVNQAKCYQQLQSDDSEPPTDLSSVIKQSPQQDTMLCCTLPPNEPLLTKADGAVRLRLHCLCYMLKSILLKGGHLFLPHPTVCFDLARGTNDLETNKSFNRYYYSLFFFSEEIISFSFLCYDSTDDWNRFRVCNHAKLSTWEYSSVCHQS